VRPAVAIAAAFAAAYSVFGIFRHRNFGSSAFDLGIFDQAVWHMSRFEAPASSISGFTNILGDHFYPVIALFVPLYWILPRPETLIVAQAVLLAASAVPVFLFARGRLPRGSALALTVAYCLYWGMQRTMEFDVHEMAFAPLAIATAILALDRRNWTTFWLAATAMVCIKEDLVPFLTGAGVYLVLQREYRRGAVLIGGSLVAFAVIVGVVVPGFNDAGVYNHVSSYGDLLARPWSMPAAMVTPAQKVETAFMWFAPFVLMSFWSPLVILAAPIAAERLLSASPTHWGTIFHYSAPLAPIVAMSAADGIARLARRIGASPAAPARRRFLTGVAAASIVLSAILPGGLPLWRLFRPAHYAGAGSDQDGRSLIAMVPDDATVVAQAAIVPHLSQRPVIHMLDADAPDADYVLAAERLSPWPAASFDELRNLLEQRKLRGYTVVSERNGWTMLRRDRATAVNDEARTGR
jgi:uncharacterized membrane protein